MSLFTFLNPARSRLLSRLPPSVRLSVAHSLWEASFVAVAWLNDFPSQCKYGKSISNNDPGEGRRKASFTARLASFPSFPLLPPDASATALPALLVLCVEQQKRSRSAPFGEGKAGGRGARQWVCGWRGVTEEQNELVLREASRLAGFFYPVSVQ